MFKGKFEDIVLPQDGFLRGPFGSALKKSLFIPKNENAYKVYEQSVVLQQDKSLGKYYISREYFENEMSRFEVKSGDFLVSCSGVNYGAIFQLKGEIDKGVINQALLRIRINQEIVDADYFLYYFRSYIVKKIIGGTGDSTIPNFPPMSVVKSIDIKLPNIEIQRKIGKILAEFDNKIVNNNIINNELEAMAKTIFDYWFLQFDFPDENGKPYKSSGGKMQWSEELNKEIPKGWCGGTLNRYIAKDKGGDWGKEVGEGNYIKRVICLRGADFPSITGNSKLAAPVRYIHEKNKSKVLENGDLIIEISGGSPTQSTGRICYINNNLLERFDTDIVTSNFCKAISLNNPNYMYWFYAQWLKIYDNNVLFRYEGKTTGIKNLLFDLFINDYNIAVPPNELIIQYNNIVCTMYEEIQKNQKESQELASLRDFLLPLLMNGQVGFK